jgi:glycosyltransferase involved in cell wall biosynthesis
MVYAAEARGRVLAAVTERELAKATPSWDVLNAQEVYSIAYLRPLADRFRVPLVLTLHGYPLFESVSEGYSSASQMGRNFLMRSEMRALRLADAVVTVDTRLYHHALRLVPERSERIHTLMNFIDTSVFAPLADPSEEAAVRANLRLAWNVPQDKVVLFCPRRLVKKNGVVYPSLALAAMNQSDRDRFFLLHAGEGGERQEMERIIRENALETNVRLLGGQGRDAILELYRLADIVLVPSVHSENVEEATSLSALEAMACGRPLIAGDVGGLAEMVVDGETGLLVPADAQVLAEAILRLAADRELGARLAAAGRADLVGRATPCVRQRAYAHIYETAVARLSGGSTEKGPGDAGEHPSVPPAEEGRFLNGGQALLPDPISVQGYPLHTVTLEQAARWVIEAAAADVATEGSLQTLHVLSFNPELVMRAGKDPQAAEAFVEADLCYPDGVGAVWAATRQGAMGVERVPGIDLAARVLEMAADAGLPVYFLGAAEGVAEEAARRQV